MNESVKPRFAVDLDEIERQLAQAGNPRPSRLPPRRSDPLAELARIVGQDDPFQSILANDGSIVRASRALPSTTSSLSATPCRQLRARCRFARLPTIRTRIRRAMPAARACYAPQPAPQDQDAYGNEAYAAGLLCRAGGGNTPSRITISPATMRRSRSPVPQGPDRDCGRCRRRHAWRRRRLPLRGFARRSRGASRRSSRRPTSRPRSSRRIRAGSRSRTRTSRSTSAPTRDGADQGRQPRGAAGRRAAGGAHERQQRGRRHRRHDTRRSGQAAADGQPESRRAAQGSHGHDPSGRHRGKSRGASPLRRQLLQP